MDLDRQLSKWGGPRSLREEVNASRRIGSRILGAFALALFVAMVIAIAQHWLVFIPMLIVPLGLAWVAFDLNKRSHSQ